MFYLPSSAHRVLQCEDVTCTYCSPEFGEYSKHGQEGIVAGESFQILRAPRRSISPRHPFSAKSPNSKSQKVSFPLLSPPHTVPLSFLSSILRGNVVGGVSPALELAFPKLSLESPASQEKCP